MLLIEENVTKSIPAYIKENLNFHTQIHILISTQIVELIYLLYLKMMMEENLLLNSGQSWKMENYV